MKKEHKIRESWVWPDKVTELVASRIEGHTLNVCAGKSTIGDVKVDMDPENKPDVVANMRALPFDDNTFDTVVSDPPWKIGYFQRWKPFFECVRVCKVGGLIIYNATWVPESDEADLRETWIRSDTPFGNASIVSIYKKKLKEATLTERINRMQKAMNR